MTLLTQFGPWPPTDFIKRSNSPTGTRKMPFVFKIKSICSYRSEASPFGIAIFPFSFTSFQEEFDLRKDYICLIYTSDT